MQAKSNDLKNIKVITTKGEKTPNKTLISEQGTWSILIVIGVFLFTALLVLIITPNLFIEFLYNLFLTPINSLGNFGDLLGQLAWLIIVGLSLMVSFRVGVFNIGVCGQFVGGAMCGYAVALSFGGPGWIGVPLVLITAIAIGTFIGWIIAKLKTIFGIHEVLSSIMFNWIILYIVMFLVSGEVAFFIQGGDNPILVEAVNPQNTLTWNGVNELFKSNYFNYGVPIALILVVFFWFMYKKTTWGYKQDILGSNINVGDYVGIDKNKEWEKSIALSGGLAGLAGVIYYLSVPGSVDILVKNALPLEAFLGITIALLGFCNPIGIFFSAILIAYLTTSQSVIQGAFNADVIGFILALLILILSMINFFLIVRPQEKWFHKKNVESVPWIKHNLDVKNNSKYIELIEDNLNYDNYDISESQSFIKYYELKIIDIKEKYAILLSDLKTTEKQQEHLYKKRDKQVEKLIKLKEKEIKKVEKISLVSAEKNQLLYEKHLQYIQKEDAKKMLQKSKEDK